MFETIIAAMKSKFIELPDARKASNGTKYLDGVPPKEVGAVFGTVYEQLAEADYLTDFRGINGTLLCGMDGTEYHTSYNVCCENCNHKQKGDDVDSAVVPTNTSHRQRPAYNQGASVWVNQFGSSSPTTTKWCAMACG